MSADKSSPSHVEVVELLIAKGASVNLTNNQNHTAASLAAAKNIPAISKIINETQQDDKDPSASPKPKESIQQQFPIHSIRG
jgi:ankyrin repeat protein